MAGTDSAAAPTGRAMTVAQIAELAGVSVPTVSRVINGQSDVSPQTRARVEDIIRTHGFRRLKKPGNKAPLLELVFHALAGSYAMEVIKGVERVAAESSPTTTCRRSACTAPPLSAAYASRRISASSASTTCPSRPGSPRR